MPNIDRLYERYSKFELLIDSRRLAKPAQTLFVALAGERTDGHAYIQELLEKGVRHFLVREAYWIEAMEQPAQVDNLSLYSEATFIAVEDPLETVQQLAAYHRLQFDIPVIGITGSNGKTIVKDWLVSLLETRFSVCSSPRSYNSQIGVPLSVWQLQPAHEIAVFEAGISQNGEMGKLEAIIAPTHGIFTNLGTAHAAGFSDANHKLSEKLKLFANCKSVFTGDVAAQKALKVAEIDIVAPIAEVLDYLSHLPAVFRYNAKLAVTVARSFLIDEANIEERAGAFQPLDLRLQVRAAANGCTIINDTYSNDLTSLAAALQFATTQATSDQLTLILSDLPQTAADQQAVYERVAGLLNGKVHQLIGVGENIALLDGMLENVDFSHYPDTKSLVKSLEKHRFHNETILLKGARTFGLEQLMDQLTSRRHRTTLEVDLNAVAHNLSVYQRQIPETTGIAAMVKASAYGSGSVQLARLLADAGVRYLVVAYTDEGIRLREAGIKTDMIVLNPEKSEFDLLQRFRLEPVVTDLETLATSLEKYPELPLHLEFDTGMRRLGFDPMMAKAVARKLVDHNTQPTSVFTHLAASDAVEYDAYTQEQFKVFEDVLADLEKEGVKPQLRHILNTNGISRFPEKAYELVRLGIGLYGIGDQSLKDELQAAITLKAAISSVRTLPINAHIGYGLKGKMENAGRVGVVSIGYADGLPRLAGEGNYSLLVNGKQAPIIGVVCMDMCMIDLSGHEEVSIDDEVIIFGPDHPIERLAKAARTIPYEILTGVGSRVHRVYTSE